MRIDWDVPIEMDDGVVLRATSSAPSTTEVSGDHVAGPVRQMAAFQTGFAAYGIASSPTTRKCCANSTNQYQNCEAWTTRSSCVPDGYVCIRVDSRGTGRSPGFLDVYSPRETLDYYHCIEWAGRSPGERQGRAHGISYSREPVARAGSCSRRILPACSSARAPPTSTASAIAHGGILNTFSQVLYGPAILSVQFGKGKRGHRSRMNGDWVSGRDAVGRATRRQSQRLARGLSRQSADDR